MKNTSKKSFFRCHNTKCNYLFRTRPPIACIDYESIFNSQCRRMTVVVLGNQHNSQQR
jgi:hypothetical protein